MYQWEVCGLLLQPLCFDSVEQRSMSCSFFLRKQHQTGMLIVCTKWKLGSLIRGKIKTLPTLDRSHSTLWKVCDLPSVPHGLTFHGGQLTI